MKKKVLIVVGCLLGLIVIAKIGGAGSTPPAVTLQEFNNLNTGIKYKKAVEIIGEPGVLAAEDKMPGFATRMYTWDNSDGSNIMLTFVNNRLEQKVQAGLE